MFRLSSVYLVPELLRLQPFAQMDAFLISILIPGIVLRLFLISHPQIFHQIFRIFLYHRPAVFQQLCVPIPQIIPVRDEIDGVRPPHGGTGRLVHHFHALIRHYRGDQPVVILVVRHIPQPFVEKCRRIHHIGSGIKKDLGIPGPPQTLPGGTVRGDVEEIALHAPERVFIETVHQFTGTGKTSRLCHIRIDRH